MGYENFMRNSCFNEYNKLSKHRSNKKINMSFQFKYLFINNGSTDDPLILLKNSGIKYLSFKKQRCYSFMMGFLYAKKYKFDILIHLAGNGK